MTPQPPAEAAPKPSRAGRNLPAAIGVGVGLAAVAVLALFASPWAFLVVVLVAVGTGMWELVAALASKGILMPRWPLLGGVVAVPVGALLWGTTGVLGAFALTCVAVMVWRLGAGSEGYVQDTTAGVFAAAYLPLAGGFAMLLASEPDGPERVVAWLLTIVASDVGGYILGVLFGKHPMAPRISPKKSWEGFGGSVAFCLVSGIASVVLLLDGSVWAGVVLGLALVLGATLGDLVESLIKRDLGLKDMGNLLPGHGGVMDRLDSIALSAPIAWLVLSTLVPVG